MAGAVVGLLPHTPTVVSNRLGQILVRACSKLLQFTTLTLAVFNVPAICERVSQNKSVPFEPITVNGVFISAVAVERFEDISTGGPDFSGEPRRKTKFLLEALAGFERTSVPEQAKCAGACDVMDLEGRGEP